MKKIGIIGSGVVGRAIGKTLAKAGYCVLFHDVDKSLLLQLHRQGYTINSSLASTFKQTDVLFTCLPTNTTNDGAQIIEPYVKLMSDLGGLLCQTSDKKLIIVKSTILPKTSEMFVKILEEVSDKQDGTDFFFCYSPEFMRARKSAVDFKHAKRVIYSGFTAASATEASKFLREIYDALEVKTQFFKLKPVEAEMVKYTANMFIATKISYFNEIGEICKQYGADPSRVVHAVTADKRISSYFSEPGRPFGGKCLPKDLDAFRHVVASPLLDAVEQINSKMKKR